VNKPIVFALGAAVVLGVAYILLRPQGATSSLINTGNAARPGGVSGVPTNSVAAGVAAGGGIVAAISSWFKPQNNIVVDPNSVQVGALSPGYQAGLDFLNGTAPPSAGGTGPVIGVTPVGGEVPGLIPPGLPSDSGPVLEPTQLVPDNPGVPPFDPNDPNTWVLGSPSPVYEFNATSGV